MPRMHNPPHPGEVIKELCLDPLELTVTAAADPAIYRVEIRSPERVWLYSNPIYVRAASAEPPKPRPAAVDTRPLFTGVTDFWRVENDATSSGQLEMASSETGPELTVRYRLGQDPARPPHVALIWGTNVPPGIPGYDRLEVTARADRPMRVIVELRVADLVASPRRWRRSLYLDRFDATRTLFFDEFTPAPGTPDAHPTLADVNAVQFFVETTNTKPGTEGKIWIKSAALQK